MTDTIIDLIRHGEPEGGRAYRGNNIDDPCKRVRSIARSIGPPNHLNSLDIVDFQLKTLPVDATNMKIRFELDGAGTLWVDDVELKLFENQERNELLKIRAYAYKFDTFQQI